MSNTKSKNTSIKHARSFDAKAAKKFMEAHALIEEEDWIGAREILQELNREFPKNLDTLNALIIVFEKLDDNHRLLQVTRQLLAMNVREPHILLAASQAYLRQYYPANSLVLDDEFLRIYPDDPDAKAVREGKIEIEKAAKRMFESSGLPTDDLEYIALMEECVILLNEGKAQQCRDAALQLLEKNPHFATALNNLSLAYWLDGDIDEAIAAAGKVLETEPDNPHALSNLIKFCLVNGEEEDAREYATRLKASQAPGSDRWLKRCEALSFIGDDQGVLDVWQAANLKDQSKAATAATQHYVAVAAWRLGNNDMALQLWNECLQVQGNRAIEKARLNVEDSKKPEGKRDMPWALGIDEWLPSEAISKLQLLIGNPDTKGAENFLAKYPYTENILAYLLERGDRSSRFIAYTLLTFAPTPDHLKVLYEFAKSQAGPDAGRGKCALYLWEQGALDVDEDMFILWISGKWQKARLINVEEWEDADSQFSKKVRRLIEKSQQASHTKDFNAEENLLRQAIQMEPHSGQLQYYLSQSMISQKRFDDARQILDEAHQKSPDDLYVRGKLASIALDDGDAQTAQSLIQPLRDAKTLSRILVHLRYVAEIYIAIIKDNPDRAQAWFNGMQLYFPQNDLDALQHFIDKLRSRLTQPSQ